MPIDPVASYLIPTVIEQSHRGERAWDIYSMLLKDRIIFLGSQINDQVANVVVAQLLYLESQDPERDVYICNIVKCRPPENRRPEPDEVAACIPYLHEQLDLVAIRIADLQGAAEAGRQSGAHGR